jgi:MFS family permease
VAVSTLHASAFQVSLVTAATYLAWLLVGLPAGVVVHRLPLRATQVGTDLVRAVALASLPVAWWLGVLTLAQLVVVALVVGLANVVFDVGNSTFLPSIVGPEELTSRNSLFSATYSTTQLAGPSLGGVLVQLLGAVPTLLVDTVSYLVSAYLLQGLPRARSPQPNSTRMWGLVREGWQFVMTHPVMRPCALSAAAVNFVCGALMALTPVFLVRVLGASAGLVGVLIAAEGAGSLVGAALNPWLVRRLGSARAIQAATLGGGLLALLMPLGEGAAGFVLFGIGNAGFAAGVVVLSINTRTHRMVASPPEILARVMATVRFVSWGAVPFGALAAGITADLAGARAALWVFCLLALLPVLLLGLSPVGRSRNLVEVPGSARA